MIWLVILGGIAALGWIVFILAAAGSTDITSRASGES